MLDFRRVDHNKLRECDKIIRQCKKLKSVNKQLEYTFNKSCNGINFVIFILYVQNDILTEDVVNDVCLEILVDGIMLFEEMKEGCFIDEYTKLGIFTRSLKLNKWNRKLEEFMSKVPFSHESMEHYSDNYICEIDFVLAEIKQYLLFNTDADSFKRSGVFEDSVAKLHDIFKYINRDPSEYVSIQEHYKGLMYNYNNVMNL